MDIVRVPIIASGPSLLRLLSVGRVTLWTITKEGTDPRLHDGFRLGPFVVMWRNK